MIKNAVASLLMVRVHLPRTAPAPTYHRLLPVPRLRPAAAMSTAAAAQVVADQKRALRTEVRKALKALSPDQRASEGDASGLCLSLLGSDFVSISAHDVI